MSEDWTQEFKRWRDFLSTDRVSQVGEAKYARDIHKIYGGSSIFGEARSRARQGTKPAVDRYFIEDATARELQEKRQRVCSGSSAEATGMVITPISSEKETGTTLRSGADSSLLGGLSTMNDESVLGSLWSNLRDVFFPAKLPPLVLVSQPIPVVDRMATRQDPKATMSAVVVYALLICLMLWGANRVHQIQKQKPMELTNVVAPLPMALDKDAMHGGGGQKNPTPVTQGRMPKFAEQQITPPKAPPMEQPKIRMPEATIEVQPNLRMANSNLPIFGMPNSPLVGNSMGNGSGGGIGPGNGNGLGPGSNGGYGDGVKNAGVGGVSVPIPIYQPMPEFSEEARRAKFQGVVTVSLIVDAQGRPQNVHVARGVGMGLDEKAIDAVEQYRFKPAKQNGKPVAAYLNVQISFDILG